MVVVGGSGYFFGPTGILGFVDRLLTPKSKSEGAPADMPNAMPQKAAE
jgi:hypothetical protein